MKPHPLKDMRHRVNVLMPQSRCDEAGGKVQSWFELGTFWAAFTPIGHNSLNIGHTLEHTITHKMTLRYDERIKPGFSVQHQERMFTIEWVMDPEERKEFLVLLCSEHLKRGSHV